MIRKVFYLLCWMLVCVPVSALEIVATVEEDTLSDFDVDERIRIHQVLLKQADVRRDKILQELIDEKIKKNYALAQQMTTDEAEIDEGMHFLEKQNGMQEGELKAFFDKNNLSWDSLRQQVQSDILWMKTVQFLAGKNQVVSAEELKAARARARKELLKPMYFVSEIFVPFGKSKKAALEKIKKAEAELFEEHNFSKTAEAFSSSPSAAYGGDLGWVPADALDKKVAEVLPKMSADELSQIIKGRDGYYLILLRQVQRPLTSTKTDVWQVCQMIVSKERLTELAPKMENMKNCMTFGPWAEKEGLTGSGMLPQIMVARTPDQLYEALKDAPVGQLVGPIMAEDVAIFLMKCQSEKIDLMPPDDVLREQAFMKKMSKESEKVFEKAQKEVWVERK